MGPPRTLVCDKGGEFISEEFSAFCSSRSIHLWRCAVQAPWANGVAEKSGGILKTLVAAVLAEQVVIGKDEITDTVAEACSAYNNDSNVEQCVTGRRPGAGGSVLNHFGQRLAEHSLIDNSPSQARLIALRETARVSMVRLHYSK